LCRYVARPALASQRLSRLPDGRLLYRLKHRWRDGTTGVVFTAGELLEKLAALVPPPASTSSASPCGVSTTELIVMANMAISLEMSLSASVLAAFGGGGSADAFNTLYFPKDGPVFNLPDGYSAVIYGLNVEGNRVGGGEVPEPATFGMVGVAVAAVVALRRPAWTSYP
jgi:hypothetical protein